MKCHLLLCCVLALLATGTFAARQPRFEDDRSLRSSSQAWLTMLRERLDRGRHSRGSEMDYMKDEGLHNKIMAIKFYVPPSLSDEFEDHWSKMEDKEDQAEVFKLFAGMLDNTYYYAYSEFQEHKDLHDHLTSNHFNKFAEMVDDSGIEWELDLLTDLSEDIEDKYGRGKAERRELFGKKSGKEFERKAHVLIQFKVEPGYQSDFMDAWEDCAERTMKDEKGNTFYSLRKVATDNQRFHVWASWETLEDYFDHLESNHWKDFTDRVDKDDIIFRIIPLEVVS